MNHKITKIRTKVVYKNLLVEAPLVTPVEFNLPSEPILNQDGTITYPQIDWSMEAMAQKWWHQESKLHLSVPEIKETHFEYFDEFKNEWVIFVKD
ncbi:MAG: hypothetical protein AABY22_18770 [Nanoarchaeota archaeon]